MKDIIEEEKVENGVDLPGPPSELSYEIKKHFLALPQYASIDELKQMKDIVGLLDPTKDFLKQIASLETKLGAPLENETYLDRVWRYLKLRKIVSKRITNGNKSRR